MQRMQTEVKSSSHTFKKLPKLWLDNLREKLNCRNTITSFTVTSCYLLRVLAFYPGLKREWLRSQSSVSGRFYCYCCNITAYYMVPSHSCDYSLHKRKIRVLNSLLWTPRGAYLNQLRSQHYSAVQILALFFREVKLSMPSSNCSWFFS